MLPSRRPSPWPGRPWTVAHTRTRRWRCYFIECQLSSPVQARRPAFHSEIGLIEISTSFAESSIFETSSDSDFTEIVPLAGLAAEQTYYLNPVETGVPQLSAPYPSFATFPADGSSRTFKFIVLTDFETVTNLTGQLRRPLPAPPPSLRPLSLSAAISTTATRRHLTESERCSRIFTTRLRPI